MDPQALDMAAGPFASPNTVTDSSWYMDFGATHYFTLDIAMMHSTRPFTSSDQVTVDDGKKLSISHIRHTSVSIQPIPLSLHNIYHTPSISNNLISVSKLFHDNQFFF